MKKINHKLSVTCLAISGLFFLASCNKALEQLAPIATPVYPSGKGIAATLAADANYSFYSAMITRAGLTASLNDTTKSFTLFATDNAGMKLFVTAASGGLVPPGAPDANFLGFISGSLPVASAAGIVQYNTVGQKIPFANIGNSFPNYPITSQIILDATQPFVRMPIFPARGATYSYVNTLPIIATDKAAANGVIHTAYSVAAPPSATLRSMIAAEPTLSFFRAAVLRADSAADVITPTHPVLDSTKFLNYLLGYGVTNMTVLPPNDAAFQALLIPMITAALIAQGVPPATAAATAAALAASPTVFSNPALYGSLSAATVKGIIAYHFLASLTASTTSPYQPNIRVFSNNVPAAPTFIKTLVNGAIAPHPGISAIATYVGPAATSLKFTGYGTFPPGGAPYSGTAANAVSMDKLAVNGVYHIIDRILLPQ